MYKKEIVECEDCGWTGTGWKCRIVKNWHGDIQVCPNCGSFVYPKKEGEHNVARQSRNDKSY